MAMAASSENVITPAVLRLCGGKVGKHLGKVWRDAWRPPLNIKISEWSAEYRRMPSSVTSEPGRYNPWRLPWQGFILDAIGGGKYLDHILIGAAQVMGKTEILNSVVGFYIHAHPSPILVKYPSLDSAEAWSKYKFDPMVEATPVLRECLSASKSRNSANTILKKKFKGGSLVCVGANSPSGLRQTSRRVVIQDEIDADEVSAGEEGDPVTLADKRAESFRNAVKVKATTPTIKGHSRGWKILEDSTFHEWHAKCPSCGEFHVLQFEALRWDKQPGVDGKDRHDVSTAHYVAPCCGATWTDIDRQRAIMAGKAIARNPDSRIFGFHLGGMYKLIGGKDGYGSMLEEFADGFISAKRGGRESLKVWTNTFKAECWDDDDLEVSFKPDEVLARAESYDPAAVLPAGVLRITAGVDVQEDRIEVELVGWGAGEESWGIGYFVFHGTTERDDVWTELDKLLDREWLHPCGKKLRVETAFIDSGARQDRVFQFTAPRKVRGVYACKGVNTPGKVVPILPRKPSTNNKRKIPQWMIGVTDAKNQIYARLSSKPGEPRSMHFPKGCGYDQRYYRQLTSEKRKLRYQHGRPYYIWEADGRRNEPLDCRVYALAALRRSPFNEEELKRELAVFDGVAPVAPVTETVEQPRPGSMAALTEPAPLPVASPTQSPQAQAPQPKLAGAFKLPDYVPVSQRRPQNGGDAMFSRG